jgi:hypothetical protein
MFNSGHRMMSRKYVLVGSKPSELAAQNPGGQITASIGLINYLRLNGHEVDIIDTTQSSFPVPSFRVRLAKGSMRLVTLARFIYSGGVSGVIIFAKAGFRFYERICMSALCRFVCPLNVWCVNNESLLLNWKILHQVGNIMCGITGIISFSKETASKSLINKMVATLSHRGPDRIAT